MTRSSYVRLSDSTHVGDTYISSLEAVWRILAFPMHQRFPTVLHLSVLLENGQRVYFNPHDLNQLYNTLFQILHLNDEFARIFLYDGTSTI